MSASESVDVIVVNYRTPDDLQGFLESFDVNEPSIPYALWIANVAPQAEDTKVAQDYAALNRNVRLIDFHYNTGYAIPVNILASAGKHSVLAIFNADTRLAAGTIDSCVRALLEHDDWGILGPRQVDDRNRITHAGIFGTHEQPRHRGWLAEDLGQFSDVAEAITVSGSAYFVKRDFWTELTECPLFQELHPGEYGAFLPTPLYYEETWCSYHAWAHGKKVIYYGSEKMVHRWHRSVDDNGMTKTAGEWMRQSQAMFRRACDAHGIPHD